jgi:hypothetical protein
MPRDGSVHPDWYSVATDDEARELAMLDDVLLATRAALHAASTRRDFLSMRLRERMRWRTATPEQKHARAAREWARRKARDAARLISDHVERMARESPDRALEGD